MCRGPDVDTSADVFFSQTALLLLLKSSADMICSAWDQRLQEEIGLMGSHCCCLDCKALGVERGGGLVCGGGGGVDQETDNAEHCDRLASGPGKQTHT